MKRNTKTKDRRRLQAVENALLAHRNKSIIAISDCLLRIRTNRLYEHAGFKSWEAYCANNRLGFTEKLADSFIQTSAGLKHQMLVTTKVAR